MALLHLVLATLLATTDTEGYCQPLGGAAVEENLLAPDGSLMAPEPYVPQYSPVHLAYEARLLEKLNGGSTRERAFGAYETLHATTPGEKEAVGRQLRDAAAGSPGDALVQHLVSIAAGEGAGCPENGNCPALRAAAVAEPDNAMAWVRAIDFRGPEDPDFDVLIVKAAQARRFDDHFVEAVEAWEKILRAQPMPRELLLEFLATGEKTSDVPSNPDAASKLYAESYAGPFDFLETRLDRSCARAASPRAPESRFEACARVGRRMLREGSSPLTQMQGYDTIPADLRTQDDEARDLDLSWRLYQGVELGGSSFTSAEAIAHFRDLVASGSDARADELQLERFGISPKAPKDWKPCKLRPY
jgi:hypothetical protein